MDTDKHITNLLKESNRLYTNIQNIICAINSKDNTDKYTIDELLSLLDTLEREKLVIDLQLSKYKI